MDDEEHRRRHLELHKSFDELMADFLAQHPGSMPSNTTLTELMAWSYEQTIQPTRLRV